MNPGPLLVVVAMAATAHADVATATYGVQRTQLAHVPLHHNDGCIAVTLDSSTITLAAQQPIESAFAAWVAAGTTCNAIAFDLTRAPQPAPAAGLTSVHLRTDQWCIPGTGSAAAVCLPPGAAAVTRLTFVDMPGDPDDGKILGADMELNGVDFELLLPGTAPTTTKPALDLQSVVTHEVGHLLGLAHDCGIAGEPWPTDELGRAVPACDAQLPVELATATMFYRIDPLDTAARTPKPNDIAGACALTAGLACERTVTGGCNTGSGGARLPWLALVVIGLRRRRPPRPLPTRYVGLEDDERRPGRHQGQRGEAPARGHRGARTDAQ